MKVKVIVLLVLVVLAFGGYILVRGNVNTNQSSNPNVLGVPEQTNKNSIDVDFSGESYRVNWQFVDDVGQLSLHPNFEEKMNAKEFALQNNCKLLVNGGFYTEDNRPTGFFVSSGVELRGFMSNQLLNGILSMNDFETPRITREIPKDNLRLAIQAGPILIENGFEQTLSLARDKEARRIVAATTGSNELVFIVIYNSDSVYNGPLLTDLPDLLTKVGDQIGVEFADAMNLDGGSASAFLDSKTSLTGISPIGSFFCVKDNGK